MFDLCSRESMTIEIDGCTGDVQSRPSPGYVLQIINYKVPSFINNRRKKSVTFIHVYITIAYQNHHHIEWIADTHTRKYRKKEWEKAEQDT